MDKQEQLTQPNYRQIYLDILEKKHPNKKDSCTKYLSKKKLSALDILELNKIIFQYNEIGDVKLNAHRSYNKHDIFEILEYQKKHNISNIQLAKKFSLSRNTVAKWKKTFII